MCWIENPFFPLLQVHDVLSSQDGLRTLVLAQKEVDPAFYEDWARRYKEAEVSLENREAKVFEVGEELEQDLELVGASAIEDQLQFNVPNTIANLKAAKIKVWVLTGDKQETAINIGAACRLLNSDMEPLLIVNGHTMEEVRSQLQQHYDAVLAEENSEHRPYGLVIDGPR